MKCKVTAPGQWKKSNQTYREEFWGTLRRGTKSKSHDMN